MRQEADDASHHVLAAAQPALPSGVERAVVAPVVVALGEQEGASRRLVWNWEGAGRKRRKRE